MEFFFVASWKNIYFCGVIITGLNPKENPHVLTVGVCQKRKISCPTTKKGKYHVQLQKSPNVDSSNNKSQ